MSNRPFFRPARRRVALVLASAATLLAAATGCGEATKAATQVAAKVNGDEITVHQVNQALRGQSIAPDRVDAAKRQALERLIDQQLARQQAVEKKLDRTPTAIQSLEAARSEILARAYLEQLAAAQTAPSDAEVAKYYAAHPELFAHRQLFGVEEINLPLSKASRGLKEQVTKVRDLREVAAWLQSQHIEYGENRGVRAAEQVPIDWLPRMQMMKSGEIQLFESEENLHLVRLVAAQPAAVDEATAKPRIRQYLANRRLSEAIAEAIKHMRERSSIEYAGEFAAARPAATGAAPRKEAAAQPGGVEKGIRALTTK